MPAWPLLGYVSGLRSRHPLVRLRVKTGCAARKGAARAHHLDDAAGGVRARSTHGFFHRSGTPAEFCGERRPFHVKPRRRSALVARTGRRQVVLCPSVSLRRCALTGLPPSSRSRVCPRVAWRVRGRAIDAGTIDPIAGDARRPCVSAPTSSPCGSVPGLLRSAQGKSLGDLGTRHRPSACTLSV